MNKSDNNNTEEHIFYRDKSDWYIINEEGNKDWSKSQEKVEEFWQLVREIKMSNLDYNFDDFVFPIFLKENFWKEGEDRSFRLKVQATEIDQIQKGSATFMHAIFKDQVDFQETTFMGHTDFWMATFEGRADFTNSTFLDETDFMESTFKDEVTFWKTTFKGPVGFWRANFEDEARFMNTIFNAKLLFTEPRCSINGILLFYRTEFSADQISKFNEWKFEKESRKKRRLVFGQVVFTDKVEFLNCDFAEVEFFDGDLVKARFLNTTFPKSRGRIKFIHEKFNPVDNKIKEKTGSLNSRKIDHYSLMGEVYRQLKKNLIEAKNWAEAGDAYRSEMTMRRRVLFRQWKKNPLNFSVLFNWFINATHYTLSVYQQSMFRPIAIMFVAWIVFAGVFYWDWQHANQIFVFDSYDFTTHLLDSAFNLFAPLGRLDPMAWEHANNEPLIRMLTYLERLLGGILLTFFVLATRARLKQ